MLVVRSSFGKKGGGRCWNAAWPSGNQEGHGLMGIVCSVKMAPFLCVLYISKALQSLRGLTLAII